jgi:hypothetical protein
LLLMLAPLLAAVLVGSSPAVATGAPCDERGSRELVAAFITAFNRGDVKSLDRLFARGMWWRWYSVSSAPGRRIQTAAYNRKTLITYFRARHKRHERLQLQWLQFNGHANGFGNFEYQLLRRADDMKAPTPRPYVGKGAISCFAGKLSIWRMGEES